MFIAPSHGPVYDKPEVIINAYENWISEKVKNKVVIPYISMHKSTETLVNYLVNRFIKAGIEVTPVNLTKADIGMLAMELVDTATVILGTPYVLAGAHPAVVYAAYLINALRPKVKFISIVGSYGWGGKGVDQLKAMLSNVKAEFIDHVLIKGYPKDEDFKLLNKLADDVINKHKTL